MVLNILFRVDLCDRLLLNDFRGLLPDWNCLFNLNHWDFFHVICWLNLLSNSFLLSRFFLKILRLVLGRVILQHWNLIKVLLLFNRFKVFYDFDFFLLLLLGCLLWSRHWYHLGHLLLVFNDRDLIQIVELIVKGCRLSAWCKAIIIILFHSLKLILLSLNLFGSP